MVRTLLYKGQFAASGTGSTVTNASDPVFILTLPRSGSTLLRFLLDAHSDMCCPPETQLSLVCASVMDTWLTYRNPDDFEERKRRGIRQTRLVAKQLIDWHLRRSDKVSVHLLC
jgi:hypothetical protein